jgi:hexosaminidase
METPQVQQDFYINKATGKKITTTPEASKKYPGDGPFTLVNGIQNELGLARTKEFVGYDGTDAAFIIDLGKETEMNEIIVHSFHQPASWIYAPSGLDISGSGNGSDFLPFSSQPVITRSPDRTRLTLKFPLSQRTRHLKITVLNHGQIPTGAPGEGNKAWLFLDEIEVK